MSSVHPPEHADANTHNPIRTRTTHTTQHYRFNHPHTSYALPQNNISPAIFHPPRVSAPPLSVPPTSDPKIHNARPKALEEETETEREAGESQW